MIPKALTYPLALVLLCSLLLGGCARYMQKLDIGEEEPQPPKAHEGLPPELAKVVQAAGGNGLELRAYLEQWEKESNEARDAASVVAGLCLADAAGLSSDELTANQEQAYAMRDARPWGKLIPGEVFRDAILPPRVDNEVWSNWRKDLPPFLGNATGARTIGQAVERVRLALLSWVVYEPSKSKGYTAPPLAIMRRAAGNERELAILLATSLRAICVPARLAGTGAGLVEYWDGEWKLVNAVAVHGLEADLVNKAEAERDKRLRHWKGSALAWVATRRSLECPREEVTQMVTEARGNWQAVAAFYLGVQNWRPHAYCAYIKGRDLRELAALNTAAALDNVRMAIATGVPDPKKERKKWRYFKAHILQDRLRDEPPSVWRGEFTERFMGYAIKSREEAYQAIAAWAGSLRLVTDLAPGPVMTPMQILHSGSVSSEHERDLAQRAALRALRLE